ncbi:MAG: hypothetical protein U0703_02405 [Anaerolineae bacterium]
MGLPNAGDAVGRGGSASGARGAGVAPPSRSARSRLCRSGSSSDVLRAGSGAVCGGGRSEAAGCSADRVESAVSDRGAAGAGTAERRPATRARRMLARAWVTGGAAGRSGAAFRRRG